MGGSVTIIQAQPGYYAVVVDRSEAVVQIHEVEIVAWNIRELDNAGNIDGPKPITIFGYADPEFIEHPTGIYTEVATGKQYKSYEWFVQCMQADLDEEREKGNV